MPCHVHHTLSSYTQISSALPATFSPLAALSHSRPTTACDDVAAAGADWRLITGN